MATAVAAAAAAAATAAAVGVGVGRLLLRVWLPAVVLSVLMRMRVGVLAVLAVLRGPCAAAGIAPAVAAVLP